MHNASPYTEQIVNFVTENRKGWSRKRAALFLWVMMAKNISKSNAVSFNQDPKAYELSIIKNVASKQHVFIKVLEKERRNLKRELKECNEGRLVLRTIAENHYIDQSNKKGGQ